MEEEKMPADLWLNSGYISELFMIAIQYFFGTRIEIRCVFMNYKNILKVL